MGPAEAREAALQLAPGCVRGQHLQPPHGPAGLLPVRPDADHRPPCRRHDRLCRATAPVGGRAVAGLARAVATPIQGLRGVTRGLRSHGHLGDDPPHAPSPRPPQPQAPACSVTSKTGFKGSALAHYVHRLARLGSPVLITGTWYYSANLSLVSHNSAEAR